MPKHGVQFVGNEEPAFIKQFKQKIGYKEGPDVNSKRNIPSFDENENDDEVPEKEDEKPVVVVVKAGDLTSEEAEAEQKEIEDGPARLDEKITFKKPVKRSKESTEGSTVDTKKKQKKDSEKGKKSQAKKTKNSSLLSFGDDEDGDF